MKILLILSSALLFSFITYEFKDAQLQHKRVSNAYEEKWEKVRSQLSEQGISQTGLRIYLRAFKHEQEIEVWASNTDSSFKLICTFPICESSGKLGPKSRRGDSQVPEGFYYINRFNPNSSFHLSLGIDYPNAADRARSKASNLGGDIFIHGNCVTIGCLPITDDLIKELYIYCVEAKDQGQMDIPITIFPCRMTEENWVLLKSKTEDESILELWGELKIGFEGFNEGLEFLVR